jgi:hypothetical protein
MAQPEPFQAEFNQTIAEEAIGRLPENASFQEIELAINGLESAIKPLGDYLTGSSSRQKNFPHSIETIALQLQNLISGGFTAEDRVNQAALKLYNALAETARRCERGRIPIPSDNTLPESFLRAQDPKIAAPILRQNINTDFTPSFTESQLLASQAKEGHAARLLEERALPPETKGRTNR